MQKQAKEVLFARWLDDQLSEEEQAEFEQLCLNDEEFAEQVSAMAKIETLSQEFEEVPVPEWDRASTMVPQVGKGAETPRSWWQWPGVSALSFATSMAAILMVTLKIQVNVTDDGVLIGFANTYSDQQIQSMLDERMLAYQADQKDQLQQYSTQLQAQQTQLNSQFADYLLTANRTERKQDFAELIKFVNQQRSDDNIYYTNLLNRMERSISSQNPDGWEPNSSINPITLDE